MSTRAPLSSKMAALLALYDLGGGRRAVHTEDVAMRAAQVAPKAFRWKRYPEQVHLERVRVALMHNKEDSPALVSGGGRSGWQLTEEGVKACLAWRGEQSGANNEDVRRIKLSKAFASWQEGGDGAVTRADVLEMLRVNDYFPESKRRERAVAFANAGASDPDLATFVAAMKRKYPEVMRT